MTDHQENPAETEPTAEVPEETGTQSTPAYTPNSFEKRTAAWVGVVYMVIIVLATTYIIFTGKALTGISFLLLPPAAVGVAVIAIYRYRKGKSTQGRNFTLALVFLCFIAFVLGLVCGIPNLLANFGFYSAVFVVTP